MMVNSLWRHTLALVALLLAVALVPAAVPRILAQTPERPSPVRPLPVACTVDAVAETDRICLGDSLLLHAVGGPGSVRWSPSDELSCADCPDPMAHPSKTTTFLLTSTAPDGCVAVDSVTVVVNALPWAYAGADKTICRGDSAYLEASFGAVSFRWEPTIGLGCPECANVWASPQTTTSYVLVAENVHGCLAYDTVVVTVVDKPVADAGDGGTICPGGSVQLHATGGARYAWTPAEGLSCADCADPVATPGRTTTYWVTASSGSSSACTATDSVTVVVTSDPEVDVTPGGTICPGDSIRLSASGGDLYEWSPTNGLSCGDCPDPIAFPTETTEYVVTARNAAGCSARRTVTVTVDRNLRTATAHLADDIAIRPGDTVRVPVLLDQPLDQDAIDRIEVVIGADEPVAIPVGLSLAGGRLEGWTVTTRREGGTLLASFTAPPGSYLTGAGALFDVALAGFLAGRDTGSIGIEVALPGRRCARVLSRAATVRIDSICGLGLRLIEMSAARYAIRGIQPNPFGPSTTIRFSLGLDGPTRVDVSDRAGRLVTTLVDDLLPPGEYTVDWDSGTVPSGIYFCTVTSGAWSERRMLLVVK